MQINRLKLSGFKSFVEPAELRIEPEPMPTDTEHEDARTVCLTAFTPAGQQLLAALQA